MTRPGHTVKPDAPARVLVVDDHEISRRYTVAALRQSGVSVKAAQRPGSALRTALNWRPDVIFVDIELPGVNGFEWMRRLHDAWPEGQPLPRLVVLSAQVSGVPCPEPAGIAVAAVLRKPAAPAELRSVLRSGGDGAVHGPDPTVERLFRRELARELKVLDGLLSQRNLSGTLPVLHRLIASCRICGQGRLESSLKALQSLCRGETAAASARARPNRVARHYYAVLVSAGPILRAPDAGSG